MESSPSKRLQVLADDMVLDLALRRIECLGKRFYEFEPTLESVLRFLRSEGFQQRLDSMEDRKQRHFVKKFLKWEASERQCAREACTSSIFESATITVSKASMSGASGSR